MTGPWPLTRQLVTAQCTRTRGRTRVDMDGRGRGGRVTSKPAVEPIPSPDSPTLLTTAAAIRLPHARYCSLSKCVVPSLSPRQEKRRLFTPNGDGTVAVILRQEEALSISWLVCRVVAV